MSDHLDDPLAALRDGAAALGIPLDDARLDQFARLRDLLLDWNTRVNLTAITDPAEVVTRHFLDALTVTAAIPREHWGDALTLMDVGSGAGFPALPLAIAFPQWRVTSLEATGKKVRFQEVAIEALGLANMRALAGRAEDLAHTSTHRAQYDVVTARAVAALPTLLEYCVPFARTGGRTVAPKKGDLAEEIHQGARAAEILGATLLPPIAVTVPPLDDGRVLLVAMRERPCPKQYPRASGAPQRRPLGDSPSPRGRGG